MSNLNQKMLAFFWQAMKPYKWWYVLVFQASILNNFHFIIYNYGLQLLIDSINQSATALSIQDLIYPLGILLFSSLYIQIVWRISNIGYYKAVVKTIANIKEQIFAYVLEHPYSYFQNTPGGLLLSKKKGIVDRSLDVFHGGLYQMSSPILSAILAWTMLFFVNVKLALVFGTLGIIHRILTHQMYKKLEKMETDFTESQHKIWATIADCFTNIFTLLSFAAGGREKQKLHHYLQTDFIPKGRNRNKFEFFTVAIIEGSVNFLLYASAIVYMIYLQTIGDISLGELVFTFSMLTVFSDKLWEIATNMGEFIRKTAELRSSFEIIATPNEPDINEGKEIMIKNPSIAFKNIAFKYQDKPVFENLNLNIKAGEKVGLVGISGAGKSTLVSLLLRYFELNSGHILIDGQDTADFSKDSVRRNIALIPQDVLLFHRSIFKNIGYGRENASQEEVIAAAKIAKIHEFIETLPEKYQTLVGERGIKLSGGQRQRIAIARAILKNAPILILDEATSSLDTQTEIEIQESIDEMFKNINATVIAIAHRLSTLRNMDRIIVLDGGKILEEGRHEILINTPNSLYKKLWELGKI